MTCYFRHLNEVFRKTGIQVTSENRSEIDRVIHNIVGVEYKNCPLAWREVKKRLAKDEEAFVSSLKRALSKRYGQAYVSEMKKEIVDHSPT